MEEEKSIVTIDCAGTVLRTYKSTLIHGCRYFHAMFKGGFAEGSLEAVESAAVAVAHQKPIFLDMDPEFFRHALNRMRDLDYEFPKKVPGLRNAVEGYLGIPWLTVAEEGRISIKTKDQVIYIAERLLRGDRVEIYFSNRWYAAEFRSAKRYMSEYVLQDGKFAAWQFHCLEDDDFTIVQVMADLYDENARTPLIRITDPDLFQTICNRDYVRDYTHHCAPLGGGGGGTAAVHS